jgi:hypothetical protein
VVHHDLCSLSADHCAILTPASIVVGYPIGYKTVRDFCRSFVRSVEVKLPNDDVDDVGTS